MPDIYIRELNARPTSCEECKFVAENHTECLMKQMLGVDANSICPLGVNNAGNAFSFEFNGCEQCGSMNVVFHFNGRGGGVQYVCHDCGKQNAIISLEKLSKRTNSIIAEWASNVRAKDHYKCQRCGCCDKRLLEAHHMIPVSEDPEMRWKYEPVNGITLCHSCHAREHELQRNWEKIMKDASNGGKMYSKYFGSGADNQSFEFKKDKKERAKQ